MNIVRYFIKAEPHEHARSDYIGFIPLWVPRAAGFDAVGSMQGMLHDMLEHSLNDTGRYHQEVLAFGRIIALRVETGVILPRMQESSAGTSLGDELYRALEDAMEATGKPADMLLPRAPHVPMRVDRHITRIISDACAGFRHTDSERPDKEITNRLAGWLKLGYIDARRRYGDYVHNIGYAFDYHGDRDPDSEFSDSAEGSVLRVAFDTASNELKMTITEPNRECGQLPEWARLRTMRWRNARV